MFRLAGLALGLTMIATIALLGQERDDPAMAQIASEFQLTAQDIRLMQACTVSMRDNGIRFASGIESLTGCGCIAREIADHVDTPDRPAAESLMKTAHTYYSTRTRDEAAFTAAIDELQITYQLSDLDLRTMTHAVLGAFRQCSRSERYVSQNAEPARKTQG